MLKKKNGSLKPGECAQAYTPGIAGLYTHEVLGASKYIQRYGKPCNRHPQDIIRVQRLSRITNNVGNYLRNPKRVHEKEDPPHVVVELIHYQYASKKDSIETAVEKGELTPHCLPALTAV